MDTKALQEQFNKGEILTFEKPTIILASQSKYRKKMMEDAGVNFIILASDFDDSDINYDYDHTNVSRKQEAIYSKEMAIAKLQPFIGKIVNGVVVTSDTTVWCQGRILEKPITPEKCKEQHEFESGKTTYIYTSIAVHYNGKTESEVLICKVKIKKLPSEVIEKICQEEGSLNCAGFHSAGAIKPYVKFAKGAGNIVAGFHVPTMNKLLKRVGFPVESKS